MNPTLASSRRVGEEYVEENWETRGKNASILECNLQAHDCYFDFPFLSLRGLTGKKTRDSDEIEGERVER